MWDSSAEGLSGSSSDEDFETDDARYELARYQYKKHKELLEQRERMLEMLNRTARGGRGYDVSRLEAAGYEATEVDSAGGDDDAWSHLSGSHEEAYDDSALELTPESQRKMDELQLLFCQMTQVQRAWMVMKRDQHQAVAFHALRRLYNRIHDPVKRREKKQEIEEEYHGRVLLELRRIATLPRVDGEFLAMVNLGIASEVRRLLKAAHKHERAYLLGLRDCNKPLTMVAVRLGQNTELLRVLLEFGADVEAADSEGDTALHWAAQRDDKLGPRLVKVLLEYGARPDAVNSSGQTPLWQASIKALVNSVDYLLQLPEGVAMVNTPDAQGWTPLQACLTQFNKDYEMDARERCMVVDLLMQHGADQFMENKQCGKSAVMLAANMDWPDLLVALRLTKPAAATPLTEGERAFYEACAARDVEALRACMDQHELRLDGTKGPVGVNEILLRAGVKRYWDVVRAAVEKDAERRVQAKVGRSVLHEAAAEGHDKLLELFCYAQAVSSHGVDLNGQDANNGMTPLMHAAAKGHEKAVIVLVTYQADPSLKDKKGRTALAYAVRNKHDVIKQILGTALAKGNADSSKTDAKGETEEEKQEAARVAQEAAREAEQKALDMARSLLEEDEAQAASSKAAASKSAKQKPKKKKGKDDKKKAAPAPEHKAPIDQEEDHDSDQDDEAEDTRKHQQAPHSSRPGQGQERGPRAALAAGKSEEEAVEGPKGGDRARDQSKERTPAHDAKPKGDIEQTSVGKHSQKDRPSPSAAASKSTKKASDNSNEANGRTPQTVPEGSTGRLLSEESTQSQGSVEGPDPLICPISFELMTDPVIASDGNTYQREAIEKWFKECDGAHKPITSLLNGADMTSRELKRNKAVLDLVRNYLRGLHPSRPTQRS